MTALDSFVWHNRTTAAIAKLAERFRAAIPNRINST
jgi:hypothetical protein